MDFEYSAKVKDLQKRLAAFMEEFIYANERVFIEQINLKAHRVARGMSRADLQRRCGVERATLASYEREKAEPSWSKLVKLMGALGSGLVTLGVPTRGMVKLDQSN